MIWNILLFMYCASLFNIFDKYDIYTLTVQYTSKPCELSASLKIAYARITVIVLFLSYCHKKMFLSICFFPRLNTEKSPFEPSKMSYDSICITFRNEVIVWTEIDIDITMDTTKDVRGEDFVILVIDTVDRGVLDLVNLRMKSITAVCCMMRAMINTVDPSTAINNSNDV